MANVRKLTRPDGTRFYQVRWRTPDGKHRTKGGFRTRKEAEDYANDVDHSQRRGATFDPKSGGVAFRDAARAWLDSRHDLKPRTRAGYEYQIADRSEIDRTFGGYPINAITRPLMSEWVEGLSKAGKKPSTVRHAFFVVRMVLSQSVADGRLAANPCDHVRLPSERSASGGTPGVVDDSEQFLTAAQVSALVDATPWPYNVMVHLAAWSGIRAAELAGLQVGDVELPATSLNPNSAAKPGLLRVERTVMVIDGVLSYDTPKTKGSRRRVPLTPATVGILRDYLAAHPRGDEPGAPLLPASALVAAKPTGRRATDGSGKRIVPKAEEVLAALSVAEAEERLTLDWSEPLRHPSFYKAIYRPAVLRANRLTPDASLPPALKFHALRHTYASLCVAAGISPLEIARFMGHSKVTTTLTVYAHLFEDDHADAMTALGAMGQQTVAANVIPMRRRG